MVVPQCRRCRRELVEGDKIATHTTRPNIRPKYILDGKAVWFLKEGQVITEQSMYHLRCLPPLLFHQIDAAGSLPANPQPSA
jgi:hypothetical protein